jgi:hypothetical protein
MITGRQYFIFPPPLIAARTPDSHGIGSGARLVIYFDGIAVFSSLAINGIRRRH